MAGTNNPFIGQTYDRSFREADKSLIAQYGVPASNQYGVVSCHIIVVFEGGKKLSSGKQDSGTIGAHSSSTSWYNLTAWEGHKNDAEIVALSSLEPQLKDLQGKAGSIYFLGTVGPCDSCKAIIRTFRRNFPKLEFKFVYRRQEAKNLTQDKPIRYGWGETATQVSIKDETYYYYYLPPKDYPGVARIDAEAFAHAQSMVDKELEKEKRLKDWRTFPFMNQATKVVLEMLERDIDDALSDVDQAVALYTKRGKNTLSAKDVATKCELSGWAKTDFLRRAKRADKNLLDQWDVPE